MKLSGRLSLFLTLFLWSASSMAQKISWVSSTERQPWKTGTLQLKKRVAAKPDLVIDDSAVAGVFDTWGTCFNELGWDALNLLPAGQKDSVLFRLFSPQGELRFTGGRLSMNANDYSRDWYSCDEVDGDFDLKYFNIDRDQTTIIPYVHAAQQYNPGLGFWVSPWSPPSWMKVNHNYAIRSNADYNKLSPLSDVILYEDDTAHNDRVFPQRITVNDYFIQDPRYLTAYANYFCKFIDAYATQHIPIKAVMYQNEAYSYTVYPGCAWTPAGTIRFNTEYLAPALQQKHPEVSLYLGTVNTNRYDLIDSILSDPRMPQTIQGVGFQWEGGAILPRLREKYPHYSFIQTESECGWGSFDWPSAEHTFQLINHYLANGCSQYYFWNAILADDGASGWGWKQNALIRVDSKKKTATYTPEYFAVRHYCQYVTPGSKLLSYKEAGTDRKPVLVFLTPTGSHVVIAGNQNNTSQPLNIQLGKRYLNVVLEPHSFNSFVVE